MSYINIHEIVDGGELDDDNSLTVAGMVFGEADHSFNESEDLDAAAKLLRLLADMGDGDVLIIHRTLD